MSPSRPGLDPGSGTGRPVPASEAAASKEAAPKGAAPASSSTQTARPAPHQAARSGSPVPSRLAPTSGPAAGVKHVRGPRPAQPPPEPPRTPPVLVCQIRGGVVESRHRGSVVEVGIEGAVRRVLGDPDTVVNLRSTVKPFGLAALVETGGVHEFDLSSAELAMMAGSHSGEDLHVRTLQGVFRRAGFSQQFLGCGSEGAPLDALTAARLAREGEKPGPIRHMCSGQHASMLLLCRLHDWPLDEYWRPDHPVQRLCAATVARAFSTSADLLVMSTDGCGVPTYAFPLREVARAFAMLADPTAIPAADSRSSLAPALCLIRDAMIANPEFAAGSRERLDSAVMKAVPGRVLAKGGVEGLSGFALLPGGSRAAASGVALKIEDGGGFERAVWAASVETLRQVGVLDQAALRALSRYHRPVARDPRGEQVGEAVPRFELAPVGELLG
jgi:L-asparaginase II